MEAHPAADLFPMLDDDELGELAGDIQANGQLQPIYTLNGQILDGRNRMRACELAGVEPTTVEYEGDDPLGFVLSLNLTRRHLTREQRAALAVRLSEMGRSQRQIAAEIGVNQSTVSRALRDANASPMESDTSPQDGRYFLRLVRQLAALDPDLVIEQVEPAALSDAVMHLHQWLDRVGA